MKASKLTNEMLADELTKPLVGNRIVIEAAARLREPHNNCRIVIDALKADNDALRAKLKVAEDALTKLQDRFVSSVHDGTIDPYEALKIAEDALAAIREEGGAK